MLNSNHPDDERLSALAAGEPDASADATLATHVASCDRCATVVRELGTLRSALADLPDVAPHRPLQLLPPVEATSTNGPDRLSEWARRIFAPALTAGAALAMVGIVGTAMPTMQGIGAGGADAAAEESSRTLAAGASQEAAANEVGAGEEASTGLPFTSASDAVTDSTSKDGDVAAQGGDASEERLAEDEALGQGDAAAAERSPWPMVLFTGVALMIAAALLRWILAPRAG